jgi:uncharacterized protein YgiB involved in biofilm formation
MSLVVALGATVSACDDPGEQVAQRDVYSGPNALENCIADWGNAELCKQQLNEAERKAMQGVPTSGGGGASQVFLWGPGYYGSDRTVTHNGYAYTPQTSRAERTAAFNSQFKPTSFNTPRPAGTSVSSRGGFGATGRSAGGGSGG